MGAYGCLSLLRQQLDRAHQSSPFTWSYLRGSQKKPQQSLGAVQLTLLVGKRCQRRGKRPGGPYGLLALLSLVTHETARPSTKDVLEPPVLACRSLDDVTHTQHGSVRHTDLTVYRQ
jgi:hypothetical protein